MKCIECGKGRMLRRNARIAQEIRGIKFEVEGKALVCSHCGFQIIPADLINEHGLLTDRAYRSAAGLLSTEEIRRARERLNLSQQAFAEYLGVGEASVKRWELGSLQDKSSDDLIRLKTDPDYAQKNLEQLCSRLGRKSPTQPELVAVFVTGRAGFQRPMAAWTSAASSVPESDALFVSSNSVN